MFKKILKNPIISGSLVLFIGSMFASFGSYLYHLLMGRMLGPVRYGELESIISILYLLTIIISTLILVVTRVTAKLKGKENLAGISSVFFYFTRKFLVWGGALSLFLIIISPLVVSFLRLSSVFPLILASLGFFVGLMMAISRGVLQGLLKFKEFSLSSLVENGLKVPIAVLLVILGFKVNGAVFALLLAALAAYLLTLFYLRFLNLNAGQKPNLGKRDFISFAFPVFFFNLSFTSLFTLDTILVKHFFSAHDAGLYASLAVLGKIIYFGSSPIPMVLFPMVVEHHSRGKKYHHLLFTSFILVLLICSGLVLTYFLVPKLMVLLLFGKEYLEIVPLLGWMGVFIALYSLGYLLTNFFLSIEKTKTVIFPLIASLMQIILVILFHQSLFQVVKISIIISGLLLLSLMLYYFYGQTKASLGHRSHL